MSRNTRIALAAATAVAATSILVGTQIVSGQSTAQETVFIPVVPCRLVDTRPAPNNVGPISTKIGAAQTVTFNAHNGNDANSDCAIPTTATAIATNTTAIQPTARTFITLYPGNATNPGTSNLNVLGGASPTPNAVNVPLAPNGEFNVFNNAGTVNIAIDINGYYQPTTAIGATGPQGPAGTPGPANRLTNEQIATLAWDEDPGREARIAVGADPKAIAFSGTNIYVANYGEFGGDAGSVTVIDPETNAVITTLPVNLAIAIAYNGTSIYVATQDATGNAGTVVVINPDNNTIIKTIPITSGLPQGIAFNGTNIYVTGTNGDTTAGTVTVINPTTNAVIGSPITVGTNPSGIAAAGSDLFVANIGSRNVSAIDGSTGVATTISLPLPIGYGPGAYSVPKSVAYTGTSIYVTSTAFDAAATMSDAEIIVINPATNIANAAIVADLGNGLDGIAYDGKNLYVADYEDDSVSVVNASSNTVIDSIDLQPRQILSGSTLPGPEGVAFDGTNIWIAGTDNFVTKILPK